MPPFCVEKRVNPLFVPAANRETSYRIHCRLPDESQSQDNFASQLFLLRRGSAPPFHRRKQTSPEVVFFCCPPPQQAQPVPVSNLSSVLVPKLVDQLKKVQMVELRQWARISWRIGGENWWDCLRCRFAWYCFSENQGRGCKEQKEGLPYGYQR